MEIARERLKRRRTKIVATVGPASAAPAILEGLVRAGADVFRLNFAHGDHASHGELFGRIAEVRERLQAPIAVLADLAGPKIRAGRFEGGSMPLVKGERVTVTTRPVTGAKGLIPSDYRDLHKDVKAGDAILLDDGKLQLEVLAVSGTEVEAEVITGGELRDRKGMNLPGAKLSVPALSDKDREDARFAGGLPVDVLGLSFVRRASDLEQLARALGEARSRLVLLAKIEKPEALGDLDAILRVADAVMVARGDLGVELEPEKVPVVQDELVLRAIAAAKPVVIATQMLESMMASLRPTRAEVSDIAHAVKSGADCVMLSGETAMGAYPVEAVAMMDRVIRETEAAMWRQGRFGSITRDDPERLAEPGARDRFTLLADGVAHSAAQLSRLLGARAIVVVSRSGASARAVAAARPGCPMVVTSGDPAVLRRMNLLWGAVPVPIAEGIEDPVHLARRLVKELEVAGPGDPVLVVRGFDPDPRKNAPTLTVLSA